MMEHQKSFSLVKNKKQNKSKTTLMNDILNVPNPGHQTSVEYCTRLWKVHRIIHTLLRLVWGNLADK